MIRPRVAVHDASVLNSSALLRGVDVAVIGGGAVGVCSSLELARRGASVAVLERGPELAWACSAGNAGIVGATHVVPLADPSAVRDGFRWMTQPDIPSTSVRGLPCSLARASTEASVAVGGRRFAPPSGASFRTGGLARRGHLARLAPLHARRPSGYRSASKGSMG